MPTWSSRYVLLRDHDADLARLRRETGDAAVHEAPGSKYAAVAVTAPALQPDDLAALSKSFGEAFSVQVHSVADLVIYDHFRDGERARGLTFAGEAGWIRVTGTPEPWEKDFFFAKATLDKLVGELEDEITDEPALARDLAEVRRLFTGGKLEEGNTRPVVQSRSMAQAVARHYGLPDPGLTSAGKLPVKKL